uniref:ascorbate ferrireductase (transmembrane) n=1 Tax=Anopheles culicifacies TaxID=139723 RepID=A0A182MTL1_9DIPT
MGKDGTKSRDITVPYDRLVQDAGSTADFSDAQQNNIDAGIAGRNQEIRQNLPVNGSYRNDAHHVSSMGGEEPEPTSAEQEQLFADYRDEERKDSVEETSVTSEGMDRDKRNGNRNVNNRAIGRGVTFSRKLILANVLINGLMFGVAGYITYHCFNKAMVLFSWHPTFMSIGYLILMSQAVLTMSGSNYFTHRCNHRTKVFIHWLLQALAGILITIASVCIFLNKIRLGKPHFQTLHGIFGLVTVCFTLASIGGGVTTKYAFQLRHYISPIYSKLAHGFAGTAAYLLAITTISLGVYSRWFQEDNDANVRLTLLIAIVTIALYVVIAPIANVMLRINTAMRSML